MAYYVVKAGKNPGIYLTWEECEREVKGFSNAIYKKFKNKEDALNFLLEKVDNKNKNSHQNQNNIPNKVQKRSNDQTNVTSSVATCSNFASNDDNDSDIEDSDNELGVEISEIKFSFDNKSVDVYTDGACSCNGTSNADAGVGVFWGVSHPLNVSRKLCGRQTNNRAEIIAAIIAIKQAIKYKAKELNLHTDSEFMINCITKWLKKWKKNGWKNKEGGDVKNIPDLKLLDSLCSKIKVNWKYVPGHSGVFGNENADRLARKALQ